MPGRNSTLVIANAVDPVEVQLQARGTECSKEDRCAMTKFLVDKILGTGSDELLSCDLPNLTAGGAGGITRLIQGTVARRWRPW